MLKVVEKQEAREATEELLPLDEIAREGARRMLIEALRAEADDYVERHRGERDKHGRALVVRNGLAQGRKLTLGTGTVELKAPRVDDRRRDEQGGRRRFTSRLLPPYMRRSPKVAEVLPILYLRGLSTGDFRPALAALLGEDAAGLSPTNITRLTTCWEQEYTAFRQRELAGREYVYVWVDGVPFNIRLEDDRLCTLVMIGARPDGEKELLAVEDGYRESEDSWASVFRDLRDRGMNEPKLVTGDGALGAWAAVSGLALAMGPVIGGILVGIWSWRAVFWFNLVFGGLALVIAAIALPESVNALRKRVDFAGFFFGAVVLGTATFACCWTARILTPSSWPRPNTGTAFP